MTAADLLVTQLNDTRDWTLNIIADLTGDDWAFQPRPGMAHALWLCGHLATGQHNLIHVRCLGRGVLDDAYCRHFPHGAPIRSATEYAYPAVDAILATMADTHAKTCAAVAAMTDDLLAEPAFGPDGKTPHPHYRDKLGAVSHSVRHEAFHAGQLATIRRLLGKPFLR
ncbi:MAG: DinB family protein [Phycisphaerae bacterium]